MTRVAIICFVTCLLGHAGPAFAKQDVFAEFTGSLWETAINESPVPGVVSIAIGGDVEIRGNSRVLGKFTARGRTDLGAVELGVTTECDGVTVFNPLPPHLGGSPEILLSLAAFQLVFTAANDDLVFAVMADPAGGASTNCISRTGEGFASDIRLEVTGGTGRFESADGTLRMRFSGNGIFNPRTQRSHGSGFTGYIEEE